MEKKFMFYPACLCLDSENEPNLFHEHSTHLSVRRMPRNFISTRKIQLHVQLIRNRQNDCALKLLLRGTGPAVALGARKAHTPRQLVGGRRAASMLWTWSSWWNRMPSTNPPMPMPSSVPAAISGRRFVALSMTDPRGVEAIMPGPPRLAVRPSGLETWPSGPRNASRR